MADIHIRCASETCDVASEGGGTNAVPRAVGNMEAMPREFGVLGVLYDMHLTIWGGVNDLGKS
jgi:hypothetical protein